MTIRSNVSTKTRNNWLLDASLFLAGLVAILSGVYFLVFPSGGFKGGTNPWYGVRVLFLRETWEWLHTWIGLAMVVIAIVHIIFHWKWVVNMTRRLVNTIRRKESNLSPRGTYNLWLNIVTGLSFLISAASGVYFLFAGGSEGGRNPDPMFLFTRGTWDVIHTWSSVVFIAALLLHLDIHWGWIRKVTQKMFQPKTPTQPVLQVAAQNQTNFVTSINNKKENNMFKKVVGITLLVAVIGLLAYGAINRTNETTVSAKGVEEGYGRGQGQRDGNQEFLPNTEHEDGFGYGLGEGEPLLENLPLGDLNQDETDALVFMREEEKLARDVYNALYEVWKLPMFANIASSEQIHMDAVLDLMDRYEMTDATPAEDGKFNTPELQALYDELVAAGSVSLEEAIKVGAAIEEIDILDLQKRLELTDQEDIRVVFENLLNGSYNHLNAFVANYTARTGEDYQPQYMTIEDFNEIVIQRASDGRGRGQQGGQGGQGGLGGGRR